jgi:ABC-type nitrate/sulfonate/bicarbonate transport system ATPase subunit
MSGDQRGLSVRIERMRYDTQIRDLIVNISFQVVPGMVTSLLGPSGAGKTTLLRIIAGLEKNYTGAVFIDDHRVLKPNLSAQLVFQDNRLLPWKTAKQNVEFGQIRRDRRLFGPMDAEGWLERLGLEDRVNAFPGEMSGGEQSRVALARALISSPAVLLLDEPLKNVDLSSRLELISLLQSLVEQFSLTVVMVSHDVDDAALLSDEVIVLDKSPLRTRTILKTDLPRVRKPNDSNVRKFGSRIMEELLQVAAIPAKT